MRINPFRVLAVVLCLSMVASNILPSAYGQELVFLNQEKVQEIALIDPDFHMQRVVERNMNFDGVLLTSKADRSLQFALLDENQSVVWQGRSRSSWVIVAESAPRMAMIGKKEREGYGAGLGRTIFWGVDVLDFSGNLIYRLDDTGPIGQAFLSPEGELLLSTATDLRLYDPDGKLLWKKANPPADAQFVGDGRYVKTYSPGGSLSSFTLRLLKTSSGEVIKEWQYNRSNELSIVAVDPKTNRLVMLEFVGGSPPTWDVVLYEIDNWQSLATLRQLEAGPFSAIWNPQENGFAILLRRPRIQPVKRPGEILLGFWNLDDGSLVTQSLGQQKVDFENDRLTYDPSTNQYQVRIGSTISVYGHTQE
ncbi:MAG: hypothetical protein O7D34_03925 [Ignavibacteria bacterium]|nr:hypothetical protein [Ignavibacteria bacterium]